MLFIHIFCTSMFYLKINSKESLLIVIIIIKLITQHNIITIYDVNLIHIIIILKYIIYLLRIIKVK